MPRSTVLAVPLQSTTFRRRIPSASALSPAGWSRIDCHWTAIKPKSCGARQIDASINYVLRTVSYSEVHSRSGHLYRFRSADVGSCSANSFTVIRRPPKTTTESSFSVDGYVPDSAVCLVLTRLEFGNSVLAGLPVYLAWYVDYSRRWMRLRGWLPPPSIRQYHSHVSPPTQAARPGARPVHTCGTNL